MEYNLLKQIVPNRSYLPQTFNFRQSSLPAFDCITPGIGSIASSFTFFVPTYNPLNVHLKKKVTVENTTVVAAIQEGKGSESDEPEHKSENLNESESNLKKDILDELNKTKQFMRV